MNRKLYHIADEKDDGKKLLVVDSAPDYSAGVVIPIISEGDTIGSVVFVIKAGEKVGETEAKLAESAAVFLGRHMEG